MPSLVVRNLDESRVIALKERAVAHQRSTEAEHRAILAMTQVLKEAKAILPPPMYLIDTNIISELVK